MSFAVFDANCKYVDLSSLQENLKKNDIPFFFKNSDGLEEFMKSTDKKRCIYFLSMEDSGLKHQIDFIKNTDQITQWMIVLINVSNMPEHSEKLSVSNIIKNIGKFDKDVSVICGKVNSLLEKINAEIQILDRKKSNIVLVTSSGKRTGKKATALALSKLHPYINFEVCGPENFKEKSEYAKHIIIVGSKISDFILPCPSDFLHRVTIFFNKLDESPINSVYFLKTKHNIITAMNSCGWDLPLEFENFHMGSALYDLFYQKLLEGEKDCNEFKMNINYYMWDKYGLPCTSSDYTKENIEEFLNKIYITPRLYKN